jgi:DMSO/TMAO reductase YedYZ molybdopterin-dependent catalytic subunit
MDNLINTPSEDVTTLYTKKPFVRCNHPIPEIKDWSLMVEDLNGKSSSWSIYALKRFKKRALTVCLECAGNSRKYLPYPTEGLQWNNCAVSNEIYFGAYLSDLHLNLNGAKEVIFVGCDEEFKRSLPVEVINNTPILLAYEMNGYGLSMEHGAPLRLIVPGWYSMASVKWLNRIIISKESLKSKYQTDKYVYIYEDGSREPVTLMKPKSMITQINPQTNTIRGKAWTGNPPIEKVEVSIDGKWHNSTITETSGTYGWVIWEKRFTELSVGQHRVCSRAWDKKGCQPDKFEYNALGYGNNAVQPFYFTAG